MVTQRTVRLSDVAAVAGVSKATASKELNGSPLVSAATKARVREVADRRIDGLLVVGAGYGRVTPSITDQFGVPVTYAFAASDNPDDSVFLPDNEQAGYLAARHLIEGGRTRVAYVTADHDDLAVRRRERGLRRALEEVGLQPVATLYG